MQKPESLRRIDLIVETYVSFAVQSGVTFIVPRSGLQGLPVLKVSKWLYLASSEMSILPRWVHRVGSEESCQSQYNFKLKNPDIDCTAVTEGDWVKGGLWSSVATSCEELTHLKRPWCWERLRAGGERDDRGWDGWMASPIQWTWVWANSRSWWWTGRPGVLQSMGWQRVRHWTELVTCSGGHSTVPLGFPLMLLTEGARTCRSKCIMPGSQIQSHVSRTQALGWPGSYWMWCK